MDQLTVARDRRAPFLHCLSVLFLTILGVVQSVDYTWEITPVRAQGDKSLDCQKGRDMILVNGQFPGPAIVANVGDTVKVNVTNLHSSQAVSMHFHGLHMKNQTYVDGASTVTQCAVGPMQSQVYEFNVTNAGTHYWHSHLSMSKTDGIQGPIIISDQEKEKDLVGLYDDELIVFLSDWYHQTGDSQRVGLDSEPFNWVGNAQSFLINGKGLYEPCRVENATSTSEPPSGCASICTYENSLASLTVQSGKTYRVRIINGASLVAVNLAIQGHNMTVVEADGTLTESLEVQHLDVGGGQRYSVLLKADQEPDSYWMTTSIRHRNAGPMGYAYLTYEGAEAQGPPPLESQYLPEHPTHDDLEAGPELDAKLFTKNVDHHPETEALKAEPTRKLVIVGTQNRRKEDNQLRWSSNFVTQSYSAKPIVLLAYEASKDGEWPTDIPGTVVVPDEPPYNWDHTDEIGDTDLKFLDTTGFAVVKLTKGDVVDLVLQNARALNGAAEYHPWHMHGHSFWVIGQGTGTYDEATHRPTFNLDNPVLRDTVSLWPLGWTAIRFVADNPGVWAFHCHISSHSAMGMGFNFVVSPDLLPPPPQGVGNCLMTSLSEVDEHENEECTPAHGKNSAFSVGYGSLAVSLAATIIAIVGLF